LKGRCTKPNKKEKIKKKKSIEKEAKKFLHLDLGGQIIRSIYLNDYTAASRVEIPLFHLLRGRSEKVKNPSKSDLDQLFLEHMAVLGKPSKQRLDARTSTICRILKKIPTIFLKDISSKSQYKSNEIDFILRAYLFSFKKWFLEFYDLDEGTDKVKLFLDYIVLSFPEKKVKVILTILQKHDLLSYYCKLDSLKEQVGIRTKASKSNFIQLIEANNCFKLICSQMLNKLSELGGTIHENDVEILKRVLKCWD
jgi:hypothetical protein